MVYRRNNFSIIFIVLVLLSGAFKNIYAIDNGDGYTLGEINPITNGDAIVEEPSIHINELPEDQLEIIVNPGYIKEEFIGRASVHNRVALYEYKDIYDKAIYIDNHIINSNVITYNDDPFEIKGVIIARYKTSDLNVNKGWPKYYYLSAVKTIEYRGGEEILPIENKRILGFVLHTEEWNRKRKIYNESMGYGEINNSILFSEYVKQKKGRYNNVFWPGEKFIIKCETEDINAEKICVLIENTSFKTNIYKVSKNTYKGYIYDEEMYYKWYGLEPTELCFIFSAEGIVNRKTIIIDGTEDYYLLHRVK